MRELKSFIEGLMMHSLVDKAVLERMERGGALYPFSSEMQQLSYLVSIGALSFYEYLKQKELYMERNKYLYLFDMAPRPFGQNWGEQHIRSLFPEFIQATKQNLATAYPDFAGEFDLWVDGIRIEVKACRANDTKGSGSLTQRAFTHQESIQAAFKYHYQQLKPSCCDVFLWIGVCRDQLLYWALSSQDMLDTGKFNPQHRNVNTGKDGVEVYEGQVFMTEQELAPFAVPETDILRAVHHKAGK